MKKHSKHILFYVGLMTVSIALILGTLNVGPTGIAIGAEAGAASPDILTAVLREFAKNMSAPIAGLLIQIFGILAFSRLCALALKRFFGQPQVVGEMIAGLLLGKSVLAVLWPDLFASLFPETAMPRLFFLSQIGLIFFMFVVGLDLKVAELKNRASTAVLVSHVSIVLPFILGTLLAWGIYEDYGPAKFSFASFALFMGIAMSITAFPVLARIIQEKKMMQTPLGTMAITCAAIDDVTAWCILAAVIGIVKAGTAWSAVGVLTVSAVYVLLMIRVARPVLVKALRPVTVDGNFSHAQLALVFCVLLGSALAAEIIGIHALFGAFLAGAVMPQSVSFRASLIEKVEDLSSVVLLPIFFVYTGLRTQVGLMDSVNDWLICGLIIVLAVAGKMGGSAVAARFSGMGGRDSWALGALMNTRGLMELVVLNIGYDIGILSPKIFAMMVLMAIGTTLMTGPLLSVILAQARKRAPGAVDGAGAVR